MCAASEQRRLRFTLRRAYARQRHQLWLVRRLGYGIVVLFVVSLVIFMATHALPTDPAQAILGRNATPQNLAALRRELGLDRSLLRQYTSWLGGVLRGDFGASLADGRPVSQLVSDPIKNSLSLLAATAVIAFPLSLALGAMTAVRRDRKFDQATLFISLGLTALPEFVVGLALVILFSTTVLKVLPAVALIPPGESPFRHPAELALPVITLVLAILPYLYRQVRASTIDVLESDYVAMARLKGMPERRVIWRHALPNALIPMIQASALMLTYLLGGVVVIEYLFGYPGLGSLLVDAIGNRDLPLIESVSLVFATGIVIFNMLADVMTVFVTPRLRTAIRQ